MIKKVLFPLIMIGLVVFKVYNDKSKLHEESEKSHWTYQGETSPEHWAEIEKNSDCDGKRQSPINIIDIKTEAKPFGFQNLQRKYSPKTEISEVVNNGHTVQFNFDKGDSIQYQNKTFHLAQIHFHEPSEHTINGIRYPLEIHLVHTNKEKEYTVISILAKEGEDSQLFEFLESFLPLKENQVKEIHQSLDLTSLFPKKLDFYSYGGSLTTPPCSETVNWIVFKEPIVVSVEEVLKLKNNMPKDNYRNEQPLNDRIVQMNFHSKIY